MLVKQCIAGYNNNKSGYGKKSTRASPRVQTIHKNLGETKGLLTFIPFWKMLCLMAITWCVYCEKRSIWRHSRILDAWWWLMTWCQFGNRRSHGDVIKWKHFPRNGPFVQGIHRWPVNSPHKGQWRGNLMFSLICAWTNGWVNNRDIGGLRQHHARYDVTVMATITRIFRADRGRVTKKIPHFVDLPFFSFIRKFNYYPALLRKWIHFNPNMEK